MKKTFIWVFLALCSGLLLAITTFDNYENVDVSEVISYNSDVYLLKYKSYSSYDEMTDDITNIERYIYIEKEGVVTAYLAIAKTKTNIKKIKKIFDDKGIYTIIEKNNIDNDEFLANLNEYEKLLSATEEENSIKIIEKQILSCYEDTVILDE